MRTADLSDLWFFLDRGLGSVVVPNALRAQGWQLTTMDERYGAELSQCVEDAEWIGEAARRGEVLLCKDRAIARGPAEAMAVYFNDARVFALAHAGVTGPEMAGLFLAAERGIVRMACRATGPYVVSVSRDGLRRLRLAYPPD
ncbi:MAG: hypothetical protein ACRDSF_03080 [Pseudonocardiaceae bacterium]